ncbi:MAG: GtrA family protein [Lactobacillales bacterium]|jgi:putative flippase GtrA|nr:GtrA family protein [Lactobacillales bacterium]
MNKIFDLYARIFKFWMGFPEKIRYLLVGGYNTVISYALYSLFLWYFMGAHPQLALFLSFLISSLNSFWTQKIFVFASKSKSVTGEYVKCLIAWGISYLINAFLLYILVNVLALNPYLAQFFALLLVTINSYLMLKYIAFKKLDFSLSFRDISIFFICLALGGMTAVFLNQDIVFDLANYHYYNGWSFMNDKTFYHLAPASLHTYFNPLIDLPTYFFVTYLNDMPWLFEFYNGLFFGVLIFISYKFSLLFLPHKTRGDKLGIAVAILFSISGFAVFRQIGTSTNEIQLAVVFLSVLYWLIKVWFFCDKKSRPGLFIILGVVLGMLCGLKWTVAYMCLPLGVAALLFARKIYRPVQTFFMMGVGGILGILLTYGHWAVQLWKHYQNPFFPFLNKVFNSPFYLPINWQEVKYLPQNIYEWLFYPFYWVFGGGYERVTDVFSLGVLMLVAYIVVFAMICFSAWRFFRRKKGLPAALNFILVFWALGYIMWIASSSVIRYAIALEILSGFLVVYCLSLLIKKEKIKAIIFMLLIYLSIFATAFHCEWYYKINKTKIVYSQPLILPDNTLVLLFQEPTAFIIPSIQTTGKVIGREQHWGKYTSLTKYAGLGEEADKLLSEPGQRVVFIASDYVTSLLTSYGLECKPLKNNFYPFLSVCPGYDENNHIIPVQMSEIIKQDVDNDLGLYVKKGGKQ